MAKVILYTQANGIVSIIRPAEGVPVETARAKDVPPDAKTPIIVDDTTIPKDRYFRDAWTQMGNSIVIDMALARALHLKKIKEKRDKELEKLDKEWFIAHGQGKVKEAKEIDDKKQVLRDIPEKFDLTKAKNPDELKALWPAEVPH